MKNEIKIIHATQNNLKHLSLTIPKHQITVFTGVSGSGKSSLVIDTLGAESQRLLNETYSSYVQNILPHFKRPNVEAIENLPVSIIINQKKLGGNARSTVGTITDIYSLLRLLYSRVGIPFIGYSMVFSFNNKQGMCPHCEGLGFVKKIELEKLVDFSKSLNEGAIRFPTFYPGGWRFSRYTEAGFFDNNLPIKQYSEVQKNLLFWGEEQTPPNPTKEWHKTAKYIGLIPRIEQAFIKKEETRYKENLEQIITSQLCPICHGQRLNETILSCKIENKSIGDCVSMPLTELYTFIQQIKTSVVSELVQRISQQINTLIRLGLGYLTLGRMTKTLSGGESQRVKMSKYLNGSLSDILYIFDEPSIGLHPHDLHEVAAIMKELVQKGNTVVIVEHDPDIIKIADHIIDMGPEAGERGGNICFQGSYQNLLASDTKTGTALREKHTIKQPSIAFTDFYSLENVSLFNIQDVNIKIPKCALTIVTGVAGSGKSTLISKLFMKQYPQSILLNQDRIYTSERANIVSFLGIFDEIRNIFAKETGQPSSLFSFNSKGACPICKGRGSIKTDLAFLGDVESECDACLGSKYSNTALKYTYRSYNIHQILQMTAEQAYQLFDYEKIQSVLAMIKQVNLNYIKLGQSLDTLSGGELQRLKLAKVLLSANSDILILDEPSTGLHEFNIKNLLKLFDFIIAQGKTLIVIEHNLSVMCHADWIIDLGPRGGIQGGKILYMGYLTEQFLNTNSYTAKYLSKFTDRPHFSNNNQE